MNRKDAQPGFAVAERTVLVGSSALRPLNAVNHDHKTSEHYAKSCLSIIDIQADCTDFKQGHGQIHLIFRFVRILEYKCEKPNS